MHSTEETAQPSPLIDFQLGLATDHKGRSIETIWSFDHFALEHTHDYIQWLFPIPETSRFNTHLPVLGPQEMQAFAISPTLRDRHGRSLDVMLGFFGLTRDGMTITALPELNPRKHIWLKSGGHNHLRISRIIRSLHLCHQEELAAAFMEAVSSISQEKGFVASSTLAHWRNATAK